MTAAQLFQVTPEAIARACDVDDVADAGLVCRNVYRWTENEALAKGADWLATAPLRFMFIFLGAFVLNRVARRVIKRVVIEMTDDEAQERKRRLHRFTPGALRSTTPRSPLRAVARAQTIGSVLKSIASVVIYSIATLMALSELGINLAPLIAGAGVVGVALGFGAQSLVKDFLSGLFMLAEDQYGVGDFIDVDGIIGEVELVSLRTTRLRDLHGTVWHVPNGEILKVGNMSQQWARALVDIQVAYQTDLDRAMEVIKDEADLLWSDTQWKWKIMEEPQVWGVQSLDASGITIRLVLKTRPAQQWSVSRELNRRLKARFDADGIEIPFPQQVTWLRRDEGSSRDQELSELDEP